VYGYAKCAWTIDNSIQYMQSFENHVDLINANLLLLHKPSRGQLLKDDQHSFPFNFPLPDSLPPSFRSLQGTVKYKILITIKRFGKSDLHFEYPFVIAQMVNLNLVANVDRPLLKVTTKEFAIDFTSKAIYMTAMLPQTGYVHNQIIDIRVEIDNRTIIYVKYVKISLKKIITLKCQTPNEHTRKVESDVVVGYCADVPAHKKRVFLKYLKVPKLTPNITNCEIIKLSYEIQVKAKTIGATRSPFLRLGPIQIGTIPLSRNNQLDYELDSQISRHERFEIAPMSYDDCMLSTPTDDVDLIDFCKAIKWLN
jgi:hypothetical protein